MQSMVNNITDVRGFKCWGAHIGIKAKRRDLALITSDVPASVAAVFTRNLVVAEPIKVTRENLANGDGRARAVVINAGNANTCTGEQGRQGALAMASTVAEELEIPKEHVIVASTGVIGRKFPTELVVKGIRRNISKLTDRNLAGSLVANAILTTDTFAKEGFVRFDIGATTVNMAGIAKGSGMIHPDMGTMIAVIACDAAITPAALDVAFREAVDATFNMITVDGDTSTNDIAVVLSNGLAGNAMITEPHGEDFATFRDHLRELCEHLAKMIVSDGEGATKFIEYKVINAPDRESARRVVRTISNSALVKTALFGRDPNWGRIIAAAGRSGVQFDPEKVDLYMGSDRMIQVAKNGRATSQSLAELKKLLRPSDLRVILSLNEGDAEAVGWGTDMSFEYVRFNSQYTT